MGEIKVGYSPIGFVRCGRSACRISKLTWKMGKETGGKKMEEPHSLKSNEMAECSFEPQQPLVCDSFKNCEGLSRVAFMDGNGVVMLGKVISCAHKEDAAGGKKKMRATCSISFVLCLKGRISSAVTTSCVES